jgi:hypothetical protein
MKFTKKNAPISYKFVVVDFFYNFRKIVKKLRATLMIRGHSIQKV